ncbi:MAG: sigma-70 family RNA polymerase sigma factor [Flavobacteriaceae bacterium]|jgi:RNA polymerase sigma factor (sigma-70 family)|nr:sigma-70 family RNA polymerase sigma factor [Flavobacteriaceae bacterium]
MQTQKLDDSVLVKSYIEGNERALEILILRHKQRIFSFIYSKVQNRDVAEDIFQDTFVKIINTLKMGKYNEEGKFLPWSMRIAHNLIIDFFRKGNRMPTFQNTDEFDIFSVICDPSGNIEKDIIRDQIHNDVRKLVEQLPEDQREVLKMRIFSDMSFKEISEQTSVSINTALGRMRYALINLRKMIDNNKIILTNQ